ncbi:hypothetical protein CLOP_g18784 [Closterium sp. NIES-67]|nr:hypothetical protein CLOP_g18784 [Closterium sp. NIES-67]
MSTTLSPLQSLLAYVQEATGLAPSTTVSLLVLIASIIYAVFSYVQHRAAPVPPPVPGPPEPIKIGEITLEELSQYSGSDPEKPILLAIRGKIYDVTRGKHFYGPGGPYEVFAGKEASRAFAKMSTDPKDAVADLTGLTYSEMETLRDWESSLQFKYDVVGTVQGSEASVGGAGGADGAGGAEEGREGKEDVATGAAGVEGEGAQAGEEGAGVVKGSES